jgi:hypothetical protein
MSIEASLIAFDRHKNSLLRHLRKVYAQRSKTKSFDSNEAWRHIRLLAWRYLVEETDVEARKKAPAADRVEQLCRLGEVLKEARAALEKVRGPVFVEWCEAYGNPDFTDPIISVYENKFDKLLPGLETAASRAAEHMRRKKGRPYGSGVLQPEFVVALEYTYRGITGKPGGACEGPFAQFVMKFLKALGHTPKEDAVVKVLKTARKSPRWGRSPLAGLG